ncbi:MAG: hypothetical protein ACFFC6_12150 [Promethearchaeota archaeon]
MKLKKRYTTVVIAISFIFIMSSTSPLSTADEIIEQITRKPTGVFLGDSTDPVVALAYRTFSLNFGCQSKLLNRQTNDPFEYSGKLVIFAHGQENGLHLLNSFYTWDTVAKLIETSPAKRIYILACYSNNILMYTNPNKYQRRFVGINGELDAEIAAYIPSIVEKSNLMQSIIKLGARVQDLVTRKVEPKLLGYPKSKSWSGHQVAVKRENFYENAWIVPTWREHILWVNLGAGVKNLFLGSGAIGIEGLIGFLIEKTPLTSPVGFVIGLIVALYVVVALSTGDNRKDEDCMFGIGAVTIPYPLVNFWFDFGSGDGGLNGVYFYPTPQYAFTAVTLYAAFALISTSWIKVL